MALGKKKTHRARVKNDISLSEIKELGGEEDDLALLTGIDDNDSEIENDGKQTDFSEEPIKKDEIKDFLKKLEIKKYRPKDEEEKKEVKSEDVEKEKSNNDEEASTSGLENSAKKKKKKSKNKFKTESDEEIATPATNKDKKTKTKTKVQDSEVSSTTVEAQSSSYKNPISALKSHMASYQPRKYLLVKTGGDWIDTEDKKGSEGKSLSDGMVSQMEEFAGKLLRDEISIYNKQKENAKRSDVGWMKTVLTSGTLADKMGALMVLVQESPLHNLAQLDTLISMTKKKGKRECLQACETLKELFMSELLPENRKLRTFAQRPLLELGHNVGWNKDSIDKRLTMWYFESKLKEKYMDFVKSLQTMSHDTVIATKQKAINTMYHLLVNKPEQEKLLLTLLINKVGDPHYKLASTVSYLLMKVVENHPNMKGVVVREVEELLFRPNISPRAQYYSVCFLTQLILSHEEQELAFNLISIYFSFFKGYVKKGEVDSKMMSALLSGVNRAFPYAKLQEEFLNEHLEPLYKIVHVVNFNTSIQALTLLYQVMTTGQSSAERYYTALYRKLMDPALKTSSKQTLYLNLLFKSLKKDESERRVKAFVKRLLQVCSYQAPQFICGALVLLSEVLRNKPGLMSLSQVQEDSDEDEHFTDEPDEDEETDLVGAKGKIPSVDQDKDQEEDDTSSARKKACPSSWIHRKNSSHSANATRYDPQVRNPQYCHAETECIWELEGLTQHYHPTVSLFAAQILSGEHITYGGDPLQDFTLIRFLDRFVYKNPKKREQISDKVQTLSKKKYSPHGVKGMSVITDQFLKLDENRVPVDDLYLHRYFNQKAARDKLKKQDDDADSDTESVGDDEFDAYLDKFEGNVDAHEVGDLNIDFASEFGKTKGKGDSDDSDSDIDGELSDEEVEFDDDDFAELREGMDSDDEGLNDFDQGDFEEADDNMEFDEENFDFSDEGDDDEFQEMAPKAKSNKRKKDSSQNTKKTKKSKMSSDLQAASEEFGVLIDENVGSKIDSIGSEAVMVKDKAGVKQIQWELKRDKWLKGKDWKAKKRGDKGNWKKFNKKKGPKKGGRRK